MWYLRSQSQAHQREPPVCSSWDWLTMQRFWSSAKGQTQIQNLLYDSLCVADSFFSLRTVQSFFCSKVISKHLNKSKLSFIFYKFSEFPFCSFVYKNKLKIKKKIKMSRMYSIQFLENLYLWIIILWKIYSIYTNLKCQKEKMETQNTFTKIFENQSVTVSALLCAETLKITVKVTDSANEHFGSVLTAEVTEEQRNEILSDFFENL